MALTFEQTLYLRQVDAQNRAALQQQRLIASAQTAQNRDMNRAFSNLFNQQMKIGFQSQKSLESMIRTQDREYARQARDQQKADFRAQGLTSTGQVPVRVQKARLRMQMEGHKAIGDQPTAMGAIGGALGEAKSQAHTETFAALMPQYRELGGKPADFMPKVKAPTIRERKNAVLEAVGGAIGGAVIREAVPKKPKAPTITEKKSILAQAIGGGVGTTVVKEMLPKKPTKAPKLDLFGLPKAPPAPPPASEEHRKIENQLGSLANAVRTSREAPLSWFADEPARIDKENRIKAAESELQRFMEQENTAGFLGDYKGHVDIKVNEIIKEFKKPPKPEKVSKDIAEKRLIPAAAAMTQGIAGMAGLLAAKPRDSRLVTAMNDADTLKLASGQPALRAFSKLDTANRVEGIDAPELAQNWGQEALTAGQKLILGKEVKQGVSKKDIYGRDLARIQMPNDKDYGLTMIQAGHAVSYGGSAAKLWGTDPIYAEATKKAKDDPKGVGLWKDNPNVEHPHIFRQQEKAGIPSKDRAGKVKGFSQTASKTDLSDWSTEDLLQAAGGALASQIRVSTPKPKLADFAGQMGMDAQIAGFKAQKGAFEAKEARTTRLKEAEKKHGDYYGKTLKELKALENIGEMEDRNYGAYGSDYRAKSEARHRDELLSEGVIDLHQLTAESKKRASADFERNIKAMGLPADVIADMKATLPGEKEKSRQMMMAEEEWKKTPEYKQKKAAYDADAAAGRKEVERIQTGREAQALKEWEARTGWEKFSHYAGETIGIGGKVLDAPFVLAREFGGKQLLGAALAQASGFKAGTEENRRAVRELGEQFTPDVRGGSFAANIARMPFSISEQIGDVSRGKQDLGTALAQNVPLASSLAHMIDEGSGSNPQTTSRDLGKLIELGAEAYLTGKGAKSGFGTLERGVRAAPELVRGLIKEEASGFPAGKTAGTVFREALKTPIKRGPSDKKVGEAIKDLHDRRVRLSQEEVMWQDAARLDKLHESWLKTPEGIESRFAPHYKEPIKGKSIFDIGDIPEPVPGRGRMSPFEVDFDIGNLADTWILPKTEMKTAARVPDIARPPTPNARDAFRAMQEQIEYRRQFKADQARWRVNVPTEALNAADMKTLKRVKGLDISRLHETEFVPPEVFAKLPEKRRAQLDQFWGKDADVNPHKPIDARTTRKAKNEAARLFAEGGEGNVGQMVTLNTDVNPVTQPFTDPTTVKHGTQYQRIVEGEAPATQKKITDRALRARVIEDSKIRGMEAREEIVRQVNPETGMSGRGPTAPPPDLGTLPLAERAGTKVKPAKVEGLDKFFPTTPTRTRRGGTTAKPAAKLPPTPKKPSLFVRAVNKVITPKVELLGDMAQIGQAVLSNVMGYHDPFQIGFSALAAAKYLGAGRLFPRIAQTPYQAAFKLTFPAAAIYYGGKAAMRGYEEFFTTEEEKRRKARQKSIDKKKEKAASNP